MAKLFEDPFDIEKYPYSDDFRQELESRLLFIALNPSMAPLKFGEDVAENLSKQVLANPPRDVNNHNEILLSIAQVYFRYFGFTPFAEEDLGANTIREDYIFATKTGMKRYPFIIQIVPIRGLPAIGISRQTPNEYDEHFVPWVGVPSFNAQNVVQDTEHGYRCEDTLQNPFSGLQSI